MQATCPCCGGPVTRDDVHGGLVTLVTGAQADAARRMVDAWVRCQDADADLARAAKDYLEIEANKDWGT